MENSSSLSLRSRMRLYVCGLLVIGICLLGLVQHDDSSTMRHLQEISTNQKANSSTCPTVATWERSYGIVVYAALLVYIFISIAFVADDYFVPSLERISASLHLSHDVAGATFMAAGCAAPELFVSLADNVFQKPVASLGIGTIVGSAIFNLLVIIGLSALLAHHVLVLDWRPLLRDSLWYIWSIVLLTIVIWDGIVNTMESIGLILSYVGYCVWMSQNERVMKSCCAPRPVEMELGDLSPCSSSRSSHHPLSSWHGEENRSSECSSVNPMHQSKYRMFQDCSPCSDTSSHPLESKEAIVPRPRYFAPVLDFPSSKNPWSMLWFLFTRPIVLPMRCTIPDSRYPPFTGPFGFISSFCCSIVWMGVLSFFTIHVATRIGCIAGISPSLMGLTVLAAGTSVPDTFSSILVARSGHGNMAVSNAVGSNVFGLLLGLGFPFFLSNLVYSQPVVVMVHELTTSLFLLCGVLTAVMVLLILSKWKLHVATGISMILLYTSYLIYVFIK